MAAGRSQPAIRPARTDDASFIARNILASQRGPLPRGWFDIALGWAEPQCLDFVERIAVAPTPSWWHVSQFIIAEVEGKPAASLCALPASGTGPAAKRRSKRRPARAGLAHQTVAIFQRGAYPAELLGARRRGRLADRARRHAAGISRARAGAGADRSRTAAGRAAGFERASISFLIGNEAAERSYAKAGFAFAEEKRDPAFEAITGSPGFRRFTRAIP